MRILSLYDSRYRLGVQAFVGWCEESCKTCGPMKVRVSVRCNAARAQHRREPQQALLIILGFWLALSRSAYFILVRYFLCFVVRALRIPKRSPAAGNVIPSSLMARIALLGPLRHASEPILGETLILRRPGHRANRCSMNAYCRPSRRNALLAIGMPSSYAGSTDFEEVTMILARRGYTRLDSEQGYVREYGRSRVRLGAPEEASPHFPYVIGRQRYDLAPDGLRWLHPQTSVLPGERGATPERLADPVEDQLRNPF
jgi:hypothetical protein